MKRGLDTLANINSCDMSACAVYADAIPYTTTLSQTSPGFYVSAVQVLQKHCWKRRNCLTQAISPFPTVFSTLLHKFLPFL